MARCATVHGASFEWDASIRDFRDSPSVDCTVFDVTTDFDAIMLSLTRALKLEVFPGENPDNIYFNWCRRRPMELKKRWKAFLRAYDKKQKAKK